MKTYAWFFNRHNFDDVKADAAYVEHLIKYNARATAYNGTLIGTSRSRGSGGKTKRRRRRRRRDDEEEEHEEEEREEEEERDLPLYDVQDHGAEGRSARVERSLADLRDSVNKLESVQDAADDILKQALKVFKSAVRNFHRVVAVEAQATLKAALQQLDVARATEAIDMARVAKDALSERAKRATSRAKQKARHAERTGKAVTKMAEEMGISKNVAAHLMASIRVVATRGSRKSQLRALRRDDLVPPPPTKAERHRAKRDAKTEGLVRRTAAMSAAVAPELAPEVLMHLMASIGAVAANGRRSTQRSALRRDDLVPPLLSKAERHRAKRDVKTKDLLRRTAAMSDALAPELSAGELTHLMASIGAVAANGRRGTQIAALRRDDLVPSVRTT